MHTNEQHSKNTKNMNMGVLSGSEDSKLYIQLWKMGCDILLALLMRGEVFMKEKVIFGKKVADESAPVFSHTFRVCPL